MTSGTGLDSAHQTAARRVFEIEAASVAELGSLLDDQFDAAVSRLLSPHGRAIVCGMGKSGIIGRKIAATLASTGTPSFFMHPGEAYHGDLGMVTSNDAFIAISNSGETDEVVKLLPFLRDSGNFLVAITGNPKSTLARVADCHLNVSVRQEACPLQLAPTSSTTASLAMGDALAVALMEARGFEPESFARFHPGGSLGRRLLSRVEHVMTTDDLPMVEERATILEVLAAITRSSLGMAVVRSSRSLAVVTDGDVRRALERYGKAAFDLSAAEMMTPDPATVTIGTRVEDAILMMERRNISAILVLDQGELVGILTK